MQKLTLTRDVQGYPATSLNLRPVAPIKLSATLASAAEATYTVPESNKNWVLFVNCNPAVNVWVAINATAAVPAGGTLAVTTSVRNPPGFLVQGGDVIHAITATANTDIGLELFPIEI